MRQIVYSPSRERLIYLHEKATPEFWETLWQSEGKPPPSSTKDEVATLTRKYLPLGASVLEGGCGRADKVKSMADAGFRAVGVDFAARTVTQAKVDYPGLDIRRGDVRALQFPDASFDGYWSIGVIEHFWRGYDVILAEAARVVKPGGFLFLSAPWLSPYRQHKARGGAYDIGDFELEPESFYQFALGRVEVCGALARHGFKVLRWRGVASEISLQEDMPHLKRQVDWLLGSRGSILKRVLRKAIVRGVDPYCGHSFIAVSRRGLAVTPSQ